MRNYLIIGGILVNSLILGGCSDNSNGATFPPSSGSTASTAAQIQKINDTGWANISMGRVDFRGSLILHIESAAGNYTVSSGDPVADPENDIFRVASNTKNYTAAAIMLLAQNGQLNIDDTLGDLIPGTQTPYLPNTANYQIPYRDTITIRQLLDHRAGVFDITNQDIPSNVTQPYAGQRYADYVREQPGNDAHTFTFDEIAGVVSSNQLSNFPPGQMFQYSNGGYSLLGEIIEQVSGMPYDQFLQQSFFTPQQFTHTRAPYLGSDQGVDTPYVPGFNYLPAPTGSVNATLDNMSVHVAEGNILSNPHELASWYRSLFTGQLGLLPATVAQMTDVQATGEVHGFYGLGTTYTPGLGYGHDGAHSGYISTSRYDPATGSLVMIYASAFDITNFPGEPFEIFNVAAAAKGLLEGRTIDVSDTTGSQPPDQD